MSGRLAAEPSGPDWALGVASSGIGHCCTGTCTRAIYYLWEKMVERSGDDLQVNLLLNRASRWADVQSYIPYQGRVDVTSEASVPQSPCASAAMDRGRRSRVGRGHKWTLAASALGRAIRKCGGGESGDTVKLTFPIAERTIKEKIGDRSYTLVVKGTTVVSIDPPGGKRPAVSTPREISRYRSRMEQSETIRAGAGDRLVSGLERRTISGEYRQGASMAIDRREFLKDTLLGCSALMLPGHFHMAALAGTDAPLKIEYIREKIPDFSIPEYKGHTYTDSVPDTLDLTERAKLGVQILTNITDPNSDYEIYWLTDIFCESADHAARLQRLGAEPGRLDGGAAASAECDGKRFQERSRSGAG